MSFDNPSSTASVFHIKEKIAAMAGAKLRAYHFEGVVVGRFPFGMSGSLMLLGNRGA